MGEIFFELRGEIDTEWVFADGSYVRAHQHVEKVGPAEYVIADKGCGSEAVFYHIAASFLIKI